MVNPQYTPRKTNMFPENQWLEDVFPIFLRGHSFVFGGVVLPGGSLELYPWCRVVADHRGRSAAKRAVGKG